MKLIFKMNPFHEWKIHWKFEQPKPFADFYVDAKADSSELLQNARFQAQAKYITEMLDTALDLLGPDVELLSKSMLELGAKSAQHGVKPEMSPFLRKALGYTLRKNLGKFAEHLGKAKGMFRKALVLSDSYTSLIRVL